MGRLSQIFWVQSCTGTRTLGTRSYHVMRNELKARKQSEYSEITPVPVTDDLDELRHEAADCQACPLFRNATQTVFGEGGPAAVVFIGEQPGDQEDKGGKPF